MKILKKKKKKAQKLNLIPILDSVFIFIFFLLMSAQFLEIYEIGSDAPAVKTTESIKDKKKPLNLTLEVYRNKITVKTGLDGETYKTIENIGDRHNLDQLNKVLTELKQKHVEENSIILRPESNVKYKKLVKIMDSARSLDGNSFIEGTTNGKKIKTKKLFDQVIFETII
jgi:biopolymer transport protein ExbD